MKIRRKILSICLALCLTLSFCPAVFADGTPVSAGDDTLTRAEAITMLWQALGSPAPKSVTTGFTDLTGSTYKDAVLWAVEQGITYGITATSFAPDQPVTRTQMAAFLYRLAGQPGKSGQPAQHAWYSDPVKWALGHALIFGKALPMSSADDSCRRAEAAEYIYRYCSAPAPADNDDIIILYTSDVHCGISSGFGYAGLAQIRSDLEEQGYTVILVDDGDAIQGEPVGTFSKGSEIVKLMNAAGYDLAIPGNHEFDYGMDSFLSVAKDAEYQYLSCNFNKGGKLLFDPYKIVEAEGKKIAFVGVTTPSTLLQSTPAIFQNEEGEYIYDFCQDATGEKLCSTLQKAVDSARRDGADYVYVIGHLGHDSDARPWTYGEILPNTSGIDVLFDGHSHDIDQVVLNGKDGKPIARSACGTKLEGIGYSLIDPKDGILETGLWLWHGSKNAVETAGIENDVTAKIREVEDNLGDRLNDVVARTAVPLTIFSPEPDASRRPVRMVRRFETNLGDLVADAYRVITGADIGVINGGGIRADIKAGDITYKDVLTVLPFGNTICVIELTGQQLLDALEWGSRSAPEENGGFLQVSGMSYTVDTSVPDCCKVGANGFCEGFDGPRRVKDVTVGGEPLDPAKKYTLAGFSYTLLENGDGYTAFDGAKVLSNSEILDNQLFIDYIANFLGGEIGSEYADPRGQGRITVR